VTGATIAGPWPRAPPPTSIHPFDEPGFPIVQRLPVIGQTSTHNAFEAVQRAAIGAAGAELQIERWERRPHQLPDAIAELRGGDFAGALVLAPHKERAAALVNALSDDARATGAVNVIIRDGAKLRGHNTDVDGLRAGLTALLPRAAGKWPRAAVVLGAGGGARAAVAVLVGTGFQRISLFNRHLHRAEAVVAHFARITRHMELRARPWHETIMEAELAKAGLLVDASGLGTEDGASPVPAELLPEGLFVLDLVLDRSATPLMRDAKERGGTVANGRASFLASSAATFRLLTGGDPSADVMREAMDAELGLPEEGAAVVGD
jgi:shikimate dehydrogenase